MAANDPLSGLHDVQLPPPPDGASMLPFIGVAVLFLLLALAGTFLFARRRNGWVHEAERVLNDLADAPPDIALSGAAGLLRRIVLDRIGTQGTKLRGEPWLDVLDRLFGTDFFKRGAGRVFSDALYRTGNTPADATAALAGLRRLFRRKRFRPW